ncbi:anti-phage ZorAB system protein ZorA [Vibrio sp. Vb1554]|uniref:anti-phage ZorAB system protein ZorA n=1 Tax=Vibrio sp. Vb1554 TaxID=3074642 RepID=UPI0029667695|nr:anti-phage ZorAB system protein ZorA [Vibrio sp. Vb1554]MDW3048245.1 anti-phage ZorAB system protein ZorA [Vibrio sp. Vb1554]
MSANLNHVMKFITSTDFIYVYCGFIFAIAIWCGVRFWLQFSPVSGSLNNALKKTKSTPKSKLEFPEYYDVLREWMNGNKYLKDSWREFEETLLLPGEDFDDDKEVIMNTHLPSVYFNQKNLLLPNVNMRFYNALPNILTGLGIVGTFIGLTVGISLAAPGLNSNDIKDAKEALNILLDGASLAFITSIVGLLTSLIFSAYEKRYIHLFNSNCQKLNSALDARVEYFSAERLASKNLAESQKQSMALQTFANDLAISLGQVIEQHVTQPMISAIDELRTDQKSASDETVTKVMGEFADKIAGAAGDEMKAFASTIKTMSDSLESQVNSLTKGQDEMQKAAQNAITGMSAAMTEGSEKINAGIDEAVNSLLESVDRSIDNVTQQLDAASQKLASNLKEGLQEFDSILGKLTETATHYQTMTDANKTLYSEISLSIETIGQLSEKANQTNLDFQRTAETFQNYILSLNNTSSQLTESTASVDSTLQTLREVQEEMSDIWNEYDERFSGLDTTLENVFKNVSSGLERYASQTDEYILGLDKHASDVVQSLAAATQEITDAVESLGEALETRTEVFESSIGSISKSAEEKLKGFEADLRTIARNSFQPEQ